MATKAITPDKIIDAALGLAADRPWQQVTLPDIADAAGIGMADLYRHYASKGAIVAAFIRRINQAVLEDGPVDADDAIKDRLFDLLMRRFDALNDHRAAVTSIMNSYRQDPAPLFITLPELWQAMVWTLETAGLSTNGIRGRLYVKGLTGVYIKTVTHWLKDDSDDLSPTMAALDKALDQAGRLADILAKVCPKPD